MIAALAAYALVAAAAFGWLLNDHLSARTQFEAVPHHILVLLPLLWGPVLLALLALLVVGVIACWWRDRRRVHR